jgi:hypothetical protein
MSDRLIERKLVELVDRIEIAVQQGRMSETEQRSWIAQLTNPGANNAVRTTVDETGQVVESGLERQLASREALPQEWLAGVTTVAQAGLREFREGGRLPDLKYVPAWESFTARVGEGPDLRGLFADMLAAEPALIEAAAEVLAAVDEDADEAARRGLILGGLYDLRDQGFQKDFHESKQGMRPAPGKPYPDVYDAVTVGRLTSFLFIRSELSEHIPTPPLSQGVSRALSEGMAGYFPSKQPLFEMLKKPACDRAEAIRQLLESAALTAHTGSDLQQTLSVAMVYRLREVCRVLAGRILDDDPETYPNDSERDRTVHLAAHALLSFGKAPDDLTLAAKVLSNAGQIRGGYRKEENRPYMEVREMGLMAVLRMLGRRPQDIGGVDRVTGYCPIKRFTKFDAIRDSERWPDINAKVGQWIDDATADEP